MAVADETSESVMPDVGDYVNLTIEGKVTSVDGTNVMVQPQLINGQEIPPTPEEEEGEMEAELNALINEGGQY